MELHFADDADRKDSAVQAFLARIPEARRLHAARGLTDEESWETLQDLPRHARLDRLPHGTPGLRKDCWVELAFSGRLFQLGRLQFEPQDGLLSIHIPEEGGALAPAAVDASLAHARQLFLTTPRHGAPPGCSTRSSRRSCPPARTSSRSSAASSPSRTKA